jgi:hypothetical protein
MINVIWPRFLTTAYRKEPISGFILAVGAVDIVIGGVGQRWTLLSFGVMIVTIAALARWLQIQKAKTVLPEASPRYYLPAQTGRTPLPLLLDEKNPR